MIVVRDMTEFVQDNMADQRRLQKKELGIEADHSGGGATAPAASLIANPHPGDGDALLGGDPPAQGHKDVLALGDEPALQEFGPQILLAGRQKESDGRGVRMQLGLGGLLGTDFEFAPQER